MLLLVCLIFSLVWVSRVARARCWLVVARRRALAAAFLFFTMMSRVFLERARLAALRWLASASESAKVFCTFRISASRSSLAFLALTAILARRSFFISLRALALYSKFLAIL